MFQPICPTAFFRCLSNSGTYTELRTTSFIESTGVACSDSVSHNRVQVLSIVTIQESEQATLVDSVKGRSSKFREGSRVRQTPEEGWRTYRPKCCGNNNKDEDNSPKTLNDKNHQASSQKFRQLNSTLIHHLFDFVKGEFIPTHSFLCSVSPVEDLWSFYYFWLVFIDYSLGFGFGF